MTLNNIFLQDKLYFFQNKNSRRTVFIYIFVKLFNVWLNRRHWILLLLNLIRRDILHWLKYIYIYKKSPASHSCVVHTSMAFSDDCGSSSLIML